MIQWISWLSWPVLRIWWKIACRPFAKCKLEHWTIDDILIFGSPEFVNFLQQPPTSKPGLFFRFAHLYSISQGVQQEDGYLTAFLLLSIKWDEQSPSFNESPTFPEDVDPSENPLRLHRLRVNRREDASIFVAGRCFLPAKNQTTVRQIIHRPVVEVQEPHQANGWVLAHPINLTIPNVGHV